MTTVAPPVSTVKRIFQNNIITISLLIVTALFSSGATFATMNTRVSANETAIVDIKKDQMIDRAEFKSQLQRIEDKVDELNRYLRDTPKGVWSK